MRRTLAIAALGSLSILSAAHAQTVMSISTLAATPLSNCPTLVFISDPGKEGLFFPDTVATGQANGGTSLACSGKLYKRIYDGAVNAKWFGLSEATADNAPAVQNAITALRDGQELFIPEGNYRFQNTIALPSGKKTRLTARGTLIFGERDGIVAEGTHAINLKALVGLTYPAYPTEGDTTISGITLKNASNSDVRVGSIGGFSYGIELTGTPGNGSQYNKVEFDFLLMNRVGIAFTTPDGTAWVNENTFYGGRIAGQIGLYARRGADGDLFNGNKFYNFGFEGLTTGVDVDQFYNNIFVAPRVEQVTEAFKFGSRASQNLIIATALYETDFVSNGQAGNFGKKNVVLGKVMKTGGTITGVLGISDDNGKLLSLIRDPLAPNTVTTVRTLPLSTLPGLTP